jgi:hypothetical protein
VTRNSNTILERDAFDGDKRDYVGGADAGMRSPVLRKIDYFCCLAHTANGRFRDGISVSDERHYAAVMISVHLFVEQIDTFNLHRREDGLDFVAIASFRKIGNTFHEVHRAGNSLHCHSAFGIQPADIFGGSNKIDNQSFQ